MPLAPPLPRRDGTYDRTTRGMAPCARRAPKPSVAAAEELMPYHSVFVRCSAAAFMPSVNSLTWSLTPSTVTLGSNLK